MLVKLRGRKIIGGFTFDQQIGKGSPACCAWKRTWWGRVDCFFANTGEQSVRERESKKKKYKEGASGNPWGYISTWGCGLNLDSGPNRRLVDGGQKKERPRRYGSEQTKKDQDKQEIALLGFSKYWRNPGGLFYVWPAPTERAIGKLSSGHLGQFLGLICLPCFLCLLLLLNCDLGDHVNPQHFSPQNCN